MTKINKHEERLANLLKIVFPTEVLYREYQFDKVGTGECLKNGQLKYRKWRFDFAYPAYKLAFEVEGGTWMGGRHVHPIGFEKDCEKYNAAVMQGWKIFRLTPKLINEEYLTELVANGFFN